MSGAGVGRYLSKRLAAMLGGAIGVEYEDGGVRFRAALQQAGSSRIAPFSGPADLDQGKPGSRSHGLRKGDFRRPSGHDIYQRRISQTRKVRFVAGPDGFKASENSSGGAGMAASHSPKPGARNGCARPACLIIS